MLGVFSRNLGAANDWNVVGSIWIHEPIRKHVSSSLGNAAASAVCGWSL